MVPDDANILGQGKYGDVRAGMLMSKPEIDVETGGAVPKKVAVKSLRHAVGTKEERTATACVGVTPLPASP